MYRGSSRLTLWVPQKRVHVLRPTASEVVCISSCQLKAKQDLFKSLPVSAATQLDSRMPSSCLVCTLGLCKWYCTGQ